MKVICIKNYDEVNSRIITILTIGKVYDLIYESTKIKYYFVADNDYNLWYDPDYFITVEQWRENQLNQILS